MFVFRSVLPFALNAVVILVHDNLEIASMYLDSSSMQANYKQIVWLHQRRNSGACTY